MPYPNSQTPVTIRLNEVFANRTAHMPALLDSLQGPSTLAQIAVTYGVIGNTPEEYAHVNMWPRSQQSSIRDAMILALMKDIAISFDWQNDSTTTVEIVVFDDRIGMTFRSPLSYPPYWGP